jgi:glycosyltransferase involved in cell wall biosynthesis
MFFAPYAVDNTRHFETIKKTLNAGITTTSVKILFVGKLIEKKRPMDLLKAYHLLQTEFGESTTELWFVGSGVQQPYLEAYISENKIRGVTFWGFQNQTKLPSIYAESDIFVLPSGYAETWGLVVNEAMCYAKPVVVSDLVGCGKDLVTTSNGFRFPYKDVSRLTEVLGKLIFDRDLRIRFGQESFRIIQGFSQEISAGNIAKVAIKIAEGNRSESNA